MKEYKYEHIKIGGMLGVTDSFQHREIINNYAKQGYTYKGYFPTKINSYGIITQVDLTFEIDKD